MTTNETIISMGATELNAPKRTRAHKMITIGAATAVAVAAVSALFIRQDATSEPLPVRTPGVQASDQALHDLVERGLIPRQALEPAPLTMDQKLRDLVDKGLIPRQALEPAPLTMDQKLQDLVNKGLIPRQALEPADI